MANVLLLAYLDPSDGGGSGVRWVVVAVIAVVILLLVIYALTRFVAWAARR